MKSKQTPKALALALAGQMDENGDIPITVTIRVTYHDLIPLARKARHEKRTMGDIIEEFVFSGDRGGEFLGFLEDYQNELPELEGEDSGGTVKVGLGGGAADSRN